MYILGYILGDFFSQTHPVTLGESSRKKKMLSPATRRDAVEAPLFAPASLVSITIVS
jgi:hypothetical protein